MQSELGVLGSWAWCVIISRRQDQGLFLDKPTEVVVEWLSVSLETLKVFNGVGIDSSEALKVLSEL